MTATAYHDVAGEDSLTIEVELPDGPTSMPVEYRVSTRASDGDNSWIEIARFTVLPGTFTLREIGHFVSQLRFEPVERPTACARIVRIVPRRR
jgi:hypothetical protein